MGVGVSRGKPSLHSGIFTYAVFVHPVLGSLPNQWARAFQAGKEDGFDKRGTSLHATLPHVEETNALKIQMKLD